MRWRFHRGTSRRVTLLASFRRAGIWIAALALVGAACGGSPTNASFGNAADTPPTPPHADGPPVERVSLNVREPSAPPSPIDFAPVPPADSALDQGPETGKDSTGTKDISSSADAAVARADTFAKARAQAEAEACAEAEEAGTPDPDCETQTKDGGKSGGGKSGEPTNENPTGGKTGEPANPQEGAK